MMQVYCKNTKTYKKFQEGVTLEQMVSEFEFDKPYPIVSAKVNNVSQGLRFRLYHNKDVEFLDLRDPSGMRVYTRSLYFLLYKAVTEVFPGCEVYVEHPIAHGYFCNLRKADKSPVTEEDVQRISERMREIVEQNVPFHRYEVHTDKAIKIFEEAGYYDKVKLLKTSDEVYTDYYTLGDTVDYYYGRLVPTAGYLKVWGLQLFHEGILLRVPSRTNPDVLAEFCDQPKTFEMFNESLRWNIIQKLSNVGDVNDAILSGHASELIQVAEALQEKKIVQIAEEINTRTRRENPLRVVLITGPSSSGKTTFSKRLSIQLKACGLQPETISTDDYFVNRTETPKLPDGSYDFDNFETVDHVKMQDDILAMMRGEDVQVPEFNFVTGMREYKGKHIRLLPGSVLLVEGIHALNPRLTDKLDDDAKYKVFINTLTSTSLDNRNCIPTSDNRLLRRIIRDANKRAFSARESIKQWPNVRKSEHDWIYPYQETADVMFNSAYLVEFAVLRNHAEPILASVPKNCPEYGEAHRLLKFIHYFTPVPDFEIPPTSLLREFLGGSSFKY